MAWPERGSMHWRQILGYRFRRHRLTKDDLRQEIAAIPADVPIIVLPPAPLDGFHAAMAKAHFTLSMNNLRAAIAKQMMYGRPRPEMQAFRTEFHTLPRFGPRFLNVRCR
jgi:hypothetical protein